MGLFTLYSNLVLTFAAVFFLVRNRWAVLSFASLAATYVSYGFWRFYQDGHWQWAAPDEGLWAGNYFLMGYWILFTAAVFLSRHEQFSGGRRASFLSLNNGAFFGAFILTMLQVHHGGFWKFTLCYGAVLLGPGGSRPPIPRNGQTCPQRLSDSGPAVGHPRLFDLLHGSQAQLWCWVLKV